MKLGAVFILLLLQHNSDRNTAPFPKVGKDKTYTFSAYVKTGERQGTVLCLSEITLAAAGAVAIETIQAGELVDSGNYSKVYGNRALKAASLNGTQRPDIIAIGKNGVVEVWEFASQSQATGTNGYKVLVQKIAQMHALSPTVTFYDPIPW